MTVNWSDTNEFAWKQETSFTRFQREVEHDKLVRLAHEAQERLESVIVPHKIAREICHDIRADLNHHLILKQRMTCLVCLARGNHPACNCSEIGRRYVDHQY